MTKPEGPAQEPLNVGGETKCKNCEQPKSAHLVSGHIYCPIGLGRACWYEPVDAATPAPAVTNRFCTRCGKLNDGHQHGPPTRDRHDRPAFTGCCGTPTTGLSYVNPQHRADCPLRNAPSQPAARELDQLITDIENAICYPPPHPDVSAEWSKRLKPLLEAWTAAKDAELKACWNQLCDIGFMFDVVTPENNLRLAEIIKRKKEAAERERDAYLQQIAISTEATKRERTELNEAWQAQYDVIKSERDSLREAHARTRSIIEALRDYMIKQQINEPYTIQELNRADAALKAGKDGQK